VAPSSLARRLKDSTFVIVATVVLLAAGTATAAKLITGKDVKDHSITGRDIKRASIPLSALRSTPSGPAGPPGASGAQGQRGAPGMVGAEGPAGPSAITEIATLNSPIATEIAPSAQFGFIGTPASILVASGDLGQVTGTVTIGSTEGSINSKIDFQLTVCFKFEGDPITPLITEEEENTGKIGLSPTLTQRTSVTVASGFAVSGNFEGLAEAEVGPCLINATTKKLDDNGRLIGTVLVAASS
jgi:hypothetical protein